MRVVIVSKALVRGVYQRTLEELVRSGEVELTVISPPSWREGTTVTPLERRFTRGYNLVVTPVVFNGHYHVHFYPGLAGLLRRLKPDLVHVDEEPYNFATWLALRQARAVGARRLFYTWQNIYRQLPLPFRLLERSNYGLAGGAIAANSDAADVLRRKRFPSPIWVIPPGLDPELYVPAQEAPSGIFHVGYLGRLVREKGLDLLIDACRTLAEPWTLTLIGDGDQRAALQRQALAAGIADRVTFAEPIASTAVPERLRQLSVLVLPSRTLPNWREQFGRVLVEAMASGVPVIGSSSGEIPHVIGDAGLIFPENDAAGLAAHLRNLQKDRELAALLRQRGRERVLERFTLRSVAGQTLDVYRALLASAT